VANPYFPGWRARVDGRPVELDLAPGEAITLAVPPGRRELELVFWPRSLIAGLSVAAFAMVLLGTWSILARRSGIASA